MPVDRRDPALSACLLTLFTALAGCRQPEPVAPTAAPQQAVEATAGSAQPTADQAVDGSVPPPQAAANPGSGELNADQPSPLPGSPAPLSAPQEQVIASHTVTATACTLAGRDLTGPIGLDTVRDLELVGDRLWLADADGNLRRYIVSTETGCALSPDSAFGTGGIVDLDRDIDSLSSDNTGRVVASSGVFESWVFAPSAAAPFPCTATSHGFLSLAPDGEYAVGRFIGRDVTRVTFTEDGCAATPEPGSVHFLSIQAIGFVGPFRLHGGMISEEAPTARPHQVIAYTATGDVAWRQGNLDDPFADDAYSAVGAIEAGSEGAVVVDPNNSVLHLLDSAGVHLGRVGVAVLTGVPSPAVGALDVLPDGRGFIGVAAKRDGDLPAWDGYVFYVTGL